MHCFDEAGVMAMSADKDLRSVNSATFGRRLALIVDETDLARWRKTGCRLVGQ
jgi:hypothetical protein